MHITNEEQARQFYVEMVHPCPRPSVDIPDDEMNEYHAHSSHELELQWKSEEFERYISQIKPKNPDNIKLLSEAWKWQNDDSTPIKVMAEKLELMMEESGGNPDKLLADCLISTTIWNKINKSDESEVRTLLRLMELAEPFADEEQRERMRFSIIGFDNESEAKQYYKMNQFHVDSDNFQTDTAERSFEKFATPENMLRWKQEYFDEWTDTKYFLNKENMGWVNLIELVTLNYGIYSIKNMKKLYNKLSDYRYCVSIDQYEYIAFYMEKVLERLYKEGEYELLERFVNLTEKILEDTPESFYKNYFLNHTPEIIEKYRAFIRDAKMD